MSESELWEKLQEIICCPDDGQPLDFCGSEYSCRSCLRHFPILSGCIADLRPRSPQPIPRGTNPQFAADYQEVFQCPNVCSSLALGWGAPEGAPEGWVRKRERQVEHVQALLQTERGCGVHTFCDFSAGAGYYTLAFARSFPLILHCDLSCDSLLYASQKAENLGMDNIAFLRIDYLRPPFAGKLDCAVCMDSLERGEGHERMLLAAIHRSLCPEGIGIVDFHNWWHNPLRRLGLLTQNFGMNRSYTRREVEALLRSCGIGDFQYLPFYQEFEPGHGNGRMAKALLPATRHVFLFQGNRGQPA